MKNKHRNPIRQEEPAPPALSRGLLRFLYATACIAGAAIMIVEILGAKMLAPYFGSSHFVWTAQIAVTLAALALGYYAGGRIADRFGHLAWLYLAILIAAFALVATVAAREWLAYRLLALPLAIGSLLAAICLFFVPLFLLAMAGPFLVRATARSLSGIGGTVGRISSISTLGSFIGTAAIGYLLIPRLPNSTTMYGTAAILALVSGIYFLGWGRRRGAVAGLSLYIVAASGLGWYGLGAEAPRIPAGVELYRGNSSFGLIQVLQPRQSSYRYYLTDYLVQNLYDTTRGTSTEMFTYMLEGLARAYTPRLDDVLCIGMGIGIVPRELAAKGSRVDVVEINPAAALVAREYFGLDSRSFNLVIGDGRWFLNSTGAKYDAVLLDAFVGDGSPSHLMSREAFEAVRRVLKPEGVLVINTFVDFSSPRDYTGVSLHKTLSAVFPSVLAQGARDANTLFVASSRSPLTILNAPDYNGVHPDAVDDVRAAFAGFWEPEPGAGILLTDDYNPVEYYDAAKRESLRRKLAMSMRTL
jgi:predicted membrane-bound spermidine synthase